MVALVAKGPTAALLVVGLTVVIHHVEGYLVGPIVLGRAVRLHTIVVLLALAGGGELAGVFGAFVAVPLTPIAVGIVDELRHGAPAPAPQTTAFETPGAPPEGGDKGPVDLEDIDREAAQVAERRVAGPEVVDGQLDPEALQVPQPLDGDVGL